MNFAPNEWCLSSLHTIHSFNYTEPSMFLESALNGATIGRQEIVFIIKFDFIYFHLHELSLSAFLR